MPEIDRPSIARSGTTGGSDLTSAVAYSPDDIGQPSPTLHHAGGLSRSSTVLRHDARSSPSAQHPTHHYPHQRSVSEDQPSSTTATANATPTWSRDLAQLPSPVEEHVETDYSSSNAAYLAEHPSAASHSAPMSAGSQHNTVDRKTSSDSGPQVTLDRWSQRRLQRLNTEQGFREQRQGGHGVLSPPLNQGSSISSGSSEQTAYNTGAQYSNQDAQPQQPLHHQQSQPHPAQQSSVGYQASRTAPANLPNVGLAIQTPSSNNPSRAGQYPQDHQQSHAGQYSPPEAQFSQDSSRPPLTQSRSFSQPGDESAMANNGQLPGPKALRQGNANNRQSVHNGLSTREGSHSTQGGQVPAFNTSIVPPGSQGGPYKGGNAQQPQGEVTRGTGTPQPTQLGDEMSEEDVAQLVKDHKELRKIASSSYGY